MSVLTSPSANVTYTEPLSPVAVYLGRLAPGSRRAMAQVLRVMAGWLGGTVATVPWGELSYAHTQAVRVRLATSYSAATANRALAALRGTLKEAFRLGHMSSEAYHRAADLEPVRGSRVAKGRALTEPELGALFRACEVTSNQGSRDAALLALCLCGLRRAEVVGLAVDALDSDHITVIGKGNKQRRIFLNEDCVALLNRWLVKRGTAAGPMLLPVGKSDRLQHRRLSPEAVAVILRRLATDAGVSTFSPHCCRYTFISTLLDAGVDLSTTAALAGHANVATTVMYDRRGDAAKIRAAQAIKFVVAA